MSRIAYVVGTRPNFVKMAPVIAAMRRRRPDVEHVVIHTGQHYDAEMSAIFLDELAIPAPDHFLAVGSGAHGAQTGLALERVEGVLMDARFDLLVVAGDVNSTLAAALAAVKLGVPIAHVESGLRSFDWTMPEEINRILVDRISTWCFTHSQEAEANLVGDGVAAERIVFVGNTMIDTLVRVLPRIEESSILERLGLEPSRYVLTTLHRPALVEDDAMLQRTLSALERLGVELTVVFPVHPRTRARIESRRVDARSVMLLDPLGYVDFLALEARAAAVVTDSGGIQEETTYLGVPCFTLRENTERPVTVEQGTNTLVGLEPERLAALVGDIGAARPPLAPPRGWDGHAAERIAGHLAAAIPAAEALAGTRG